MCPQPLQAGERPRVLYLSLAGAGELASETREVSSFHSVEVHGTIDIEVEVGTERRLEVSGDASLLPYLITDVVDGRLILSMDRDCPYRRDMQVIARIGMDRLDAVHLEGSGDAILRNVSGGDLEIQVNGSGDLFARGEVEHLLASVHGSGNLELYDLRARTAALEIQGSGDIEAHVTDELEGSVRGSGDIRYRGKPRVTRWSVRGSGDLHGVDR